jgi:hypothetical protein
MHATTGFLRTRHKIRVGVKVENGQIRMLPRERLHDRVGNRMIAAQ